MKGEKKGKIHPPTHTPTPTFKLHTCKWICGDRGGWLSGKPVWPAIAEDRGP